MLRRLQSLLAQLYHADLRVIIDAPPVNYRIADAMPSVRPRIRLPVMALRLIPDYAGILGPLSEPPVARPVDAPRSAAGPASGKQKAKPYECSFHHGAMFTTEEQTFPRPLPMASV